MVIAAVVTLMVGCSKPTTTRYTVTLVADKKMVPGWVQFVVLPDGVMYNIYYPDEYYLITMDGKMQVDKDRYGRYEIGSRVHIREDVYADGTVAHRSVAERVQP
jgi:hypothetical protein